MVAAESVLTNLEGGTLDIETEEDEEKRKANQVVSVVCTVEIPQQDLDKMNNKFQEYGEAQRCMEGSLRHLNYRTKLLDPDWLGWRIKSFVVVDPSNTLNR
jgi:hypothetical protein